MLGTWRLHLSANPGDLWYNKIMEAMMTKKNNGRLIWSQRSDEKFFHRNWADETQWTVPFVLSVEANVELAGLTPEEAKARICNWFHSALTLCFTPGPVRGSSYGAASWGVMDVNYTHGAPCGTAVVYRSVGIGD